MANSEAGNAPFDYAAQWDAPETEELTLPSGKKVVVGPAFLPGLAARGLIPNHLLKIVEHFTLKGWSGAARVINGEGLDAAGEPLPDGERLRQLNDYSEYVKAYCVAAIVAPRFSFDGRPGTIAIDRLGEADRVRVWNWGEGLLAPLAAFPADGAGALEPVAASSDGAHLRDEAERAPGADAG